MKRRILFIMVSLFCASILHGVLYSNDRSETFTLDYLGLRVGSDLGQKNFTSYEAFASLKTPWAWKPSQGSSLHLAVDGSVGLLRSGSTNGGIFQIGPAVEFNHDGLPLFIRIGTAPTYLSRDVFKNTDLGGNFHLTSSLTIGVPINEQFALLYRFQHTSNGGIEPSNPGIDLHTLGFAMKF